MIPIYIVSLPEAIERRARISHIFDNLEMEYSFVDAVDGRQFDVPHHPFYLPQKRLAYFGKHLTGGDLGCTLSHKKIYQKMLNENIQRALIIEDDILFRDQFFDTLNAILNAPIPFDMVRFFGSPKLERLKLRKVYCLNSTHSLDRHNGMPGGSHATLMTLAGAQKMLDNLHQIYLPIDAILGRSWVTKINWYTVRPGIAAQDRTLESSIGDDRFDRQKDITGWAKTIYPVTRAWFKLCESVGKKYWYFKTYFWDKKYANF